MGLPNGAMNISKREKEKNSCCNIEQIWIDKHQQIANWRSWLNPFGNVTKNGHTNKTHKDMLTLVCIDEEKRQNE